MFPPSLLFCIYPVPHPFSPASSSHASDYLHYTASLLSCMHPSCPTSIQLCIPPVLHSSSSILPSQIPPVPNPPFPASLLSRISPFLESYISHVLHLTCPASLLILYLSPFLHPSMQSCIPTFLHPSSPASLQSCTPTFLHPPFLHFKRNEAKQGVNYIIFCFAK